MKKKLLPIFFILLFANTVYFVMFSGRLAPRRPFEKSVILDEQNKQIAIKDFKGEVLIVTYFQTWCGDCRKELKELNALQEKFPDELKILVITDESFEKSHRVKDFLKINLPFYKSEKSLKEIGIRRFPTTYLLNKEGNIEEAKVEAIYWNTKEIQDKIVELNKP